MCLTASLAHNSLFYGTFRRYLLLISFSIKSFHLELLATDFLGKSLWRHHNFFWIDWIIRDFFAYLYHRANSFVVVPVQSSTKLLTGKWFWILPLTAKRPHGGRCSKSIRKQWKLKDSVPLSFPFPSGHTNKTFVLIRYTSIPISNCLSRNCSGLCNSIAISR